MLIARRVFFALLSSFILAQAVLSSYVTRQPGQSLRDDDQNLVRRVLDPTKYKPLLDWQIKDVRYQSLLPPAPEVKTIPVTNQVEVEQASPQATKGEPQATKGKPQPIEGKPQPTEGKPQPTESRAQPTNGKYQPTERKPQPTNGKSQTLKKTPTPMKVSRPKKVKLPRTKVGPQLMKAGPRRKKVGPQRTKVPPIQQQLTKVPKRKSRMRAKAGALSAVLATGAIFAGASGTAFAHEKGLFKREGGPVFESLEQETTNPLLHSYETGALMKE